MKDFKTWSSCNTDAQVVEDLIARSADTLASLRVEGSHVDCLRVSAKQVLQLPHLHKLVVPPTYTELEGQLTLQVRFAQLKALQVSLTHS